jgi:hypothetical protein
LLPLLLLRISPAQPGPDFHFPRLDSATGLRLTGAARQVGQAIQLTPLAPKQSGALWLVDPRPVTPAFETEFTFRLLRARNPFIDGSDGLAFVIQNAGPDASGGIGSAGGFSVGRGDNPPRPGIARSLALFFDTHRNAEEGDPSSNSIGLYTNADGIFPPRRLAILPKAPVRLNDGKPHRVRIRYQRPHLAVWLDQHAVLRENVAIESIVGSGKQAYLGFTAATGDGYQIHEILSWRFTATEGTAESRLLLERTLEEQVTSEIRFAGECLGGRTLCTPPAAEVTPLSPRRWRILLPAHLAAPASIPNPKALAVALSQQQGTICWKAPATGAALCHGPEGDALGRGRIRLEHRDGRTLFTIDTAGDRASNEGYFTFEAVMPD